MDKFFSISQVDVSRHGLILPPFTPKIPITAQNLARFITANQLPLKILASISNM